MILAFYQAEIEYRHRDFVYNTEVNANIMQIAQILTSDNSKFGLLICGSIGIGKTTFLHAIQNLINWLRDEGFFEQSDSIGMTIKPAKELAFIARNNYEKFMTICKYPKILAIDDMGVDESKVLDYGNQIGPIMDLLEIRYDYQLPTFITTNMNSDEIGDKYDLRIRDRLAEMVDQVIFESIELEQNGVLINSYRKIQS